MIRRLNRCESDATVLGRVCELPSPMLKRRAAVTAGLSAITASCGAGTENRSLERRRRCPPKKVRLALLPRPLKAVLIVATFCEFVSGKRKHCLSRGLSELDASSAFKATLRAATFCGFRRLAFFDVEIPPTREKSFPVPSRNCNSECLRCSYRKRTQDNTMNTIRDGTRLPSVSWSPPSEISAARRSADSSA
jgi:hypothetical protein